MFFSSKTFRAVLPTNPVAPTMAILYVFIRKPPQIRYILKNKKY